jgi:hypothetical protein
MPKKIQSDATIGKDFIWVKKNKNSIELTVKWDGVKEKMIFFMSKEKANDLAKMLKN